MNVYDFDGTIYHGDSTKDFFRYSLKKHPLLVRYMPRQLWGFFLYAIKRIDKTAMKEMFYCFLKGIDGEKLVEEFWDSHEKNIYPFYKQQQRADDIFISASPEFLLEPICKRLSINHLMASRVDIKTGAHSGKNCRGEEKVKRLFEKYGEVHIEKFYSDSLADLPLAKLAEQAFMITKDGQITPWPEN
ncbi:MAG: HAD-IB family phosphatase [Clostridia bacterium]|nr:HAD-IB family phosphatase [Clostridia bacterium]